MFNKILSSSSWWSVKTPKLGISSPSKAVVRFTSFWAQMVDIMLQPFVGAAAPFLSARLFFLEF